MEIKKRIRKDFQPLTTVATLETLTPNSPVTQVYDAAVGTYEPDRSITPCVIRPNVMAGASDGSWNKPVMNSSLGLMKWYVNGLDITTLPTWVGKYSIETYGENRGTITIYRNVDVSESFELHFEAEFTDARFGLNVPVKTDPITLSTTDKSEDSWAISISAEPTVTYNPFMDKLLIYDYKVANNLIIASSENRNAAIDGNQYERIIPITVHKGTTLMANGYTLTLYKVNGDGTLTQQTTADLGISAFSITSLTLDLRLIEKADYLIIVKDTTPNYSNRERARIQFSVNRIYPEYTTDIMSDVSILPTDVEHRNRVLVHYNNDLIPVPEPILRLLWKTDSYNKTGVEHNEGSTTIINLARAGVGSSYIDDWMDIGVYSEQKGVFTLATDELGETYTDENGEQYITN